MRIIAVDPGETIGLAFLDTETGLASWSQEEAPLEAIWTFQAWRKQWDPDFNIVEDYNSAGHLSREGKHTIKVLGMFQYGYNCEVVHPQARLAFVDKATEMIGDEAKTLHRKGRDAISALAHALAWADSHGDD